MQIVLLYFQNLGHWALSFKTIAWDKGYTFFSLPMRVIVWLNIGVNTIVFAGDPRITCSLHAQRSGGLVMDMIAAGINKIFHPGGPWDRPWGEGTEDDRNLPVLAQLVVMALWIFLLIVLF